MSFLSDPVGWWIDPFMSNEFMVRALAAGLLAVVSTSVVGTWVVLRGMSFLGDALAHGVLPGIAIAFMFGIDPAIGALVAALVMVWGVNLIRAHSPLPDDTSIGVLFVGFLALAVVIMSSRSGSYTGDLNRFLFGSVTGVDAGDLRRQAVAAAITVVGVALFHRAFLVMTFDETLAALLGLRPRLAHGVLLALLAFSIVASFEAVGNLLVFAFLVAPPATATLLVRRVPWIMGTAVLIGSASVIVGLLLSYHNDTAAGATMALTAVVGFVAVLLVRSLADGVGRGIDNRKWRTMKTTGLGFSALLIAAGAILAWAVTYEAEGIDLNQVGVILFIVGIVLGLVTLAFAAMGTRTTVHSEHNAVVDGRPVAERDTEVVTQRETTA